MEETDTAFFSEQMRLAGVSGGALLSYLPNSLIYDGIYYTPQQKLDKLLKTTSAVRDIYPFYFIDPTESDAADQVALAIEYGVSGFKVICNHFFPGDERAMRTYTAIAKTGKPVLFHSGILYDAFDSSNYNRPAGFEALFDIEGLRFAMAHISWPWCDEMIALFGKYRYAHRRNNDVELFVDVTPGTPGFYREEALTKLIKLTEFRFTENMIFGVDNNDKYSSEYAINIINTDKAIYDKLGVPENEREKIFQTNFMRFLGFTE